MSEGKSMARLEMPPRTGNGRTNCIRPLLFFLFLIFFFPLIGSAAGNDDASAPAMAQRFVEFSRSTLQAKHVDKANWRQALELLKAAVRLDPDEARYARLLVEAQLRNGDASGAAEALKAYRVLRPDDRVAQVQLIDLYVGRIETADAKLKYLQLLLGDESLPAAVRSHVAVHAARVQWASLRHSEADKLLEEALKLNPLNMDALQMRYDTSDSATITQRVATLLAMLKSNPGQPRTAEALAEELADAGLVDLSTDWYRRSASLLVALNQPMSPAFAVNYAAELYMAEQPQLAESMIGGLLKAFPADMNGLYIAMLSARQSGEQDKLKQYSDQIVNAAMNRLATTLAAADKTTPTTRPLDAPPPPLPSDLATQAKTMKKADAPQRDDYISALGDLAWIELYFKDDAPAANQAIDALKVLLPPQSVTLARLEGWQLLVNKKYAEAKVKLSATADSDPLSALGVIRAEIADQKENSQAKADAVKLLSANPSGLLGAFVWDGVRNLGVKRATSQATDGVHAQIDQFSRDWLKILDQPQRFYNLRFDPIQVGHEYNEPMIARVTVRNISDQDLTIGEDGVIHPDLWIDAQLRGLHQQAMPAVAYARLGDRLILHPGESITRRVRVDQGALENFLKSDPGEPIQVAAGVTTNPVIGNGGAAPGPAGQRAELSSIFQRDGFAMRGEADKQQLFSQIRSGSPVEKIRGVSLLAVYIGMFRSDKATDSMKQSVGDMLDVLRKAAVDPDENVAAWSSYLDARLMTDAQRWDRLESMAHNASWTQRLLAAVAVQSLPVQRQRELAGILASDKDIIVKAYAAALAESAATTRPATQPAPKK
jgi:tetratricopeptide (TPR) repeat protein